MMRLTKLFTFLVLTSTFIISCDKDDDGGVTPIEVRDKAEQAVADDAAIKAYLETHFYNYEDFENPADGFNYSISLDTIAGDNADKTPLISSDLLETKTITRDDIDYTIYILKVREGVGSKPTFADSTFQNYRGELLNRQMFDNSANPVWFDHPGAAIVNQNNPGIAVQALTEAMVEFGGASGFTVNADNTITWNNDFGVGAVFLPSGLGYFNQPTPTIPAYSPLIFSFRLYQVNQADHDNDGIPSYMEDLDGDKSLFNDNSDKDSFPNYLDADDDGDGTPTKNEIIIKEDGTIEFPDSNSNGIPDYLDPDTF